MDRLERIKEEQRKIEQEAQEQAKIDERKQKEQADTLKPVSTPEVILAQVNIYFRLTSCMGPKKQDFWPRTNCSQIKLLNQKDFIQ